MQYAIGAALITVIFFSIRGIISLIIILFVGKKIKNYLDNRKVGKKTQSDENKEKF